MNHFLKNSIVLALGLAAVSVSALAQSTASAPAEPGVTLGVGVIVAPEYLGAKKERFQLAPFVSYRNPNGFYAGTHEGVGYTAKLDNFSLSAGVGYRFGRTDSKENGSFKRGSNELKGMGDISDAFTARIKGGYKFDGGPTISLGTEMALSNRETGNTYTLGLNMPLLESKTDRLSLELGATYGDRKFNQSNFGVTAAQSTASGYKAFNTKAGFEQVAAGVNWNHMFDKNWSITTRAGLVSLVGDSADSPIVKKKTSGVVMTAVGYSF